MWQYNYTPEPNELYHHGIKGMQWGKRRYQNPDGTLTPVGKKRYAKVTYKEEKKQAYERQQSSLRKLATSGKSNDLDAVLKINKRYDTDLAAAKNKYKSTKNNGEKKVKKIVLTSAGVVAGAATVAVGAKVTKNIVDFNSSLKNFEQFAGIK